MSTKRGRVITVATAGTLTLATAISVAGATLSTTSAAAGTTDAYMTSVSAHAISGQAARPAGANGLQQAVLFDQMRSIKAHEAAAVKAAAAAKARAAAAKAAAKAAKARADAAKAAKATAAANAAVATHAATVSTPSGTPQQIAQQMLGQFGWSGSQFSCLQPLWQQESRWSVTAENASSGAYGIPQALPGSQMASAGGNWQTSAATQIKWGLTYIQSRYGSPCGAEAHEQSAGWY
jgi:hypothetical protein